MTFDTTSPWGTWKPKGAAAFSLKLIDLLPASGLFRKLAFLLRKPVKNSGQDVYDREIWELKLRLGARGNLTEQRWLTMANFHDAPEREALRRDSWAAAEMAAKNIGHRTIQEREAQGLQVRVRAAPD